MSDERPRLVSFTLEGFDAFLSVLHKTYGSAGGAMIYDMSEEFGKVLIHSNIPNLPDDLQARIATMKMFAERFGPQGWGKLILKEIDIERGSVKVVLEDMPFRPCKGSEDNPLCIFTRGTLAGLLEAALNVGLRVKNLDCGVGSVNCEIDYEVS